MLSKVLQTLANGVEFSAKAGEEYMTVMNGFLQNNQSAIVSYLKHMSVCIASLLFILIGNT